MAKLEAVAPKLPMSCAVSVAGHKLRVPVASNALQQRAGLRDRFGFAGMLFDPAPGALTMSGVKLPLQAILARPAPGGYAVVGSIQMVPGTELYPVTGNGEGGVLLELFSPVVVSPGDILFVSECEMVG